MKRFLASAWCVPVILAGTLGFAACSDPAADKPKASVAPASDAPAAAAPAAEPPAAATSADAATAPAASAEPAPAESFALTPANTTIGFVGSKVTGSHEGAFPAFTGEITLVGGSATGGSIKVELDMTALTSDNERLTGHLKSKDFFEVETFPKASFQSTAITAGGEAGATHTITGDLELHGVKKSISFPSTIEVSVTGIKANSEFALNRKDFGVVYAGKPDDLIRDNVVLKLAVNIPKQP